MWKNIKNKLNIWNWLTGRDYKLRIRELLNENLRLRAELQLWVDYTEGLKELIGYCFLIIIILLIIIICLLIILFYNKRNKTSEKKNKIMDKRAIRKELYLKKNT